MAHYIFEGRAPFPDGDGGLLRPLDVREFGTDPGRPWRELEAAEKPAEPDEPPPGPKVSLPAATALTASTAPPKPGTTED